LTAAFLVGYVSVSVAVAVGAGWAAKEGLPYDTSPFAVPATGPHDRHRLHEESRAPMSRGLHLRRGCVRLHARTWRASAHTVTAAKWTRVFWSARGSGKQA